VRPSLNKLLGPILLAMGAGLILFVVCIAYGEYSAARGIALPRDVQSSLTEMLSLFSVVAVKAIFLAFIVWGGGTLLSNGIKLLREEGKEEKG